MFKFVPPEKWALPRRRRHYRAIQDRLDEKVAEAHKGVARFHVVRKAPDGSETDLVQLMDGREIPYGEAEVKAIQAARQWRDTGEGEKPFIPVYN